MATDQTTKFRLEQIEARLVTLGNRLHDVATSAHESKLRLDEDVQRGADREKRLRNVEIYIEHQQGMSIMAKAIMALLGLIAGGLGELIMRHF